MVVPSRLDVQAFAVGLGLLAVTPAAYAQEYCVACTGPAAVYRCQIANMGPAQRQPLKLLCLSTLAKAGTHENCAIKDGTVLDCVGPLKRIDVLGKPVALPAGTPQPTEPYVLPEPTKNVDESQPPRTVEEALRRATKSTGEGSAGAGKSISDGATKTWNCLSSLFASC